MASQFPLRQQRKAQTRASLIRSAQALFNEKGFENTTLEQVAEHAGLHVQTLYRHFRCKQDLITASDQEYLERFQAAITAPDRVGDTITFWEHWLERTWELIGSDGGEAYHARLRHLWGAPFIASQLITISHTYEDLLADSFEADVIEDTAPGTSRMMAITLYHACAHVVRQYYAAPENHDFAAEAIASARAVRTLYGHLLRPVA